MANSLTEALDLIRERGSQFYVYVLLRHDGEPFYVGKGRHDRIACHERNARRNSDQTRKTRVVRAMLGRGEAVGYCLVGFWDDEALAFEEERRLIALHRRADSGGLLVNHTDGGEGGANPSAETIRKRAKKLRGVMMDPAYKAAAVAALRGNEEVRKQHLREALLRPEYRAATRERLKREWADPEIAGRRVAGMHAAQDLVWKARHAEGVARVQADPAFHAARNAGLRRPEVLEKRRVLMAEPGRRAAQSAAAKLQRARQEAVRTRVKELAACLGARVSWPVHTSAQATWEDIERRLLAGERDFDADPNGTAAAFSAGALQASKKNRGSVRSADSRARMSESAKRRWSGPTGVEA